MRNHSGCELCSKQSSKANVYLLIFAGVLLTFTFIIIRELRERLHHKPYSEVGRKRK